MVGLPVQNITGCSMIRTTDSDSSNATGASRPTASLGCDSSASSSRRLYPCKVCISPPALPMPHAFRQPDRPRSGSRSMRPSSFCPATIFRMRRNGRTASMLTPPRQFRSYRPLVVDARTPSIHRLDLFRKRRTASPVNARSLTWAGRSLGAQLWAQTCSPIIRKLRSTPRSRDRLGPPSSISAPEAAPGQATFLGFLADRDLGVTLPPVSSRRAEPAAYVAGLGPAPPRLGAQTARWLVILSTDPVRRRRRAAAPSTGPERAILSRRKREGASPGCRASFLRAFNPSSRGCLHNSRAGIASSPLSFFPVRAFL